MTDPASSSADPVKQLAQAETQATAARGRLSHTLAILQVRLKPKRLARDAKREVTHAGGLAAQRTADTARRNPGAIAGFAAVAGLILARHRIADLFHRLRRRRHATGGAEASLPDERRRKHR